MAVPRGDEAIGALSRRFRETFRMESAALLECADPGTWRLVAATSTTGAMLYASAHGDTVDLRVIDRGPGIPPQDFGRIFPRSSASATGTTPPGSA